MSKIRSCFLAKL